MPAWHTSTPLYYFEVHCCLHINTTIKPYILIQCFSSQKVGFLILKLTVDLLCIIAKSTLFSSAICIINDLIPLNGKDRKRIHLTVFHSAWTIHQSSFIKIFGLAKNFRIDWDNTHIASRTANLRCCMLVT